MKTQTGLVALTLAISIPCLLCGGCLLVASNSVNRTAATSERPPIDSSPAKQQAREQIISQLIASGILSRCEDKGGGLVKVWTGPEFAALTVQEKEKAAGVVYAYYFYGQSFSDAVELLDGRTGAPVGQLTKAGLRLER
jgi:hypothetical protein